MKNSLSHILAFCLMILAVITFLLISFQIELRFSVIKKNLQKNDYYYEAYDNILSKSTDYIINDEVLEIYKNYLNVGIIKEDVNKTINNIVSDNKEVVSRYSDFYEMMINYCKDDVISKKYALELDKIYINNLFPTKELKSIKELYIPSTNLLLFTMALLLIFLIVAVVLFFINKNFKFHVISLLTTSILLMLPLIFIKVFNIFENFLYTNTYYTEFLISIVNNSFSSAYNYGVLILLILVSPKLIKKIKHKV